MSLLLVLLLCPLLAVRALSQTVPQSPKTFQELQEDFLILQNIHHTQNIHHNYRTMYYMMSYKNLHTWNHILQNIHYKMNYMFLSIIQYKHLYKNYYHQ